MKLRILTAAAVFAAIALPALAQPADDGAAGAPGPGPGGQRGRGGFAAMDTNKDGVVTKDEWVAAGRREQAFDRIDANHDGKITPDEMAAARRGRQGNGPGGGGDAPPPAQPQ